MGFLLSVGFGLVQVDKFFRVWTGFVNIERKIECHAFFFFSLFASLFAFQIKFKWHGF